jgi:hypothetical protein
MTRRTKSPKILGAPRLTDALPGFWRLVHPAGRIMSFPNQGLDFHALALIAVVAGHVDALLLVAVPASGALVIGKAVMDVSGFSDVKDPMLVRRGFRRYDVGTRLTPRFIRGCVRAFKLVLPCVGMDG